MLQQRRAAARGPLLNFAHTLARRAERLASQAEAGGDSITAASEDMRCVFRLFIGRQNWDQHWAPGADGQSTHELLCVERGCSCQGTATQWDLEGAHHRRWWKVSAASFGLQASHRRPGFRTQSGPAHECCTRLGPQYSPRGSRNGLTLCMFGSPEGWLTISRVLQRDCAAHHLQAGGRDSRELRDGEAAGGWHAGSTPHRGGATASSQVGRLPHACVRPARRFLATARNNYANFESISRARSGTGLCHC